MREHPLDAVTLAARRARAATFKADAARMRVELDEALQNRCAPMHSAQAPAACMRVFGRDAIYVFDGGNTAVWCTFFSEVNRPGGLLSTFKFGMLGAGVGQALGAQVARPGSRVVCIIGDGAMGFHMQELEAAKRHGLPIIFVVLCDRQWGMVKMTQAVGLGAIRAAIGAEQQGTINADFEEIAFDEVARAMGCYGERVSHPDDLDGALRRCGASGKPAVLHVDVDPQLHMFAPGLMEFKAMHQEPGAA